jgi:hypothetical protein
MQQLLINNSLRVLIYGPLHRNISRLYPLYTHNNLSFRLFVRHRIVFYRYEQVSEWLLFNANSAIFQLYHGDNKLIDNQWKAQLIKYFIIILPLYFLTFHIEFWKAVPIIKTIHTWYTIWASEWLLFNANSAIFQLYHGDNKLIFNEMMMRFALC